MLTIGVWNRKGGVGKTNSAIQIAGWSASQGRKTSLVDLDPQGGSLIFAGYAKQNGKELPFHVGRKPAADSEYIIFDHSPGVNSGGALGSFVIVPTILDASSFSITLKSIDELKNEMKKPYLLLPNRVEIQNKEQGELLERIQEKARAHGYEQPFIRKRVAYPRAYGMGITVFEPKSGLPSANDAQAEFEHLLSVMGSKIKQLASGGSEA